MFDDLKKAAGMYPLGHFGADDEAPDQTGPIQRERETLTRWPGRLFSRDLHPQQTQPAPPANNAPAPAERGEYAVMLEDCGANKILTIKVTRELTGLGLREAKELVESAPCVFVGGVSGSYATAVANRLLAAGALAHVTAMGSGTVMAPDVSAPAALSADQGFCPHCGKRITTVGSFCPYCGNRLAAPAAQATLPVREDVGGGVVDGGSTGAAYDVVLEGFGNNKIQAIKVVRELTGLGLREAKDLVDGAPSVVLRGVSRAQGEEAVSRFEQAGASARVVWRG